MCARPRSVCTCFLNSKVVQGIRGVTQSQKSSKSESRADVAAMVSGGLSILSPQILISESANEGCSSQMIRGLCRDSSSSLAGAPTRTCKDFSCCAYCIKMAAQTMTKGFIGTTLTKAAPTKVGPCNRAPHEFVALSSCDRQLRHMLLVSIYIELKEFSLCSAMAGMGVHVIDVGAPSV